MNNGGPAFPVLGWDIVGGEGIGVCMGGMTLRDYFAATALTGLCSLGAGMFGKCLSTGTPEENQQDNFDQMAIMSYKFSDAMLAAREAK